MDGYILQLSIDLDNWTGKPNPRYAGNAKLEELWNGLNNGTVYHQTGKRALLRYLKEKSPFNAQNLVAADFDAQEVNGPKKIVTFDDLVDYLKKKNVKAPPLVTAVTFVIKSWLGNVEGEVPFYAETELESDLGTEDFATVGVTKLVRAFQTDGQLGKCPAVRAMTTSLFTSGSVTTVGRLCHYLKDCAV